MTAQRIGPSFACECPGKIWFNPLCFITGREWQQGGLDQILPSNVLARFGPILSAVMSSATAMKWQQRGLDQTLPATVLEKFGPVLSAVISLVIGRKWQQIWLEQILPANVRQNLVQSSLLSCSWPSKIMKRMINMTKKYDKDDKADDKYDKNNDKGARKIIKMIKKTWQRW